MGFRKIRLFVFLTTVILIASFAGAQSKGLKAISIEDMKFHMQFLASKEFQGRSAPSVEDDIAAKYIALIMAERPKRSIIFVWNTA
jgi:hypothetical protein